MNDLPEWVQVFGPTGALLIAALISGWKGWWCWARELANERERRIAAETERDEWKRVAFSGTTAAEYLAKERLTGSGT